MSLLLHKVPTLVMLIKEVYPGGEEQCAVPECRRLNEILKSSLKKMKSIGHRCQ